MRCAADDAVSFLLCGRGRQYHGVPNSTVVLRGGTGCAAEAGRNSGEVTVHSQVDSLGV